MRNGLVQRLCSKSHEGIKGNKSWSKYQKELIIILKGSKILKLSYRSSDLKILSNINMKMKTDYFSL